MAELTDREFWFITVYFKNHHGFRGSHDIISICNFMSSLLCYDSERLINSLSTKNIFSLSPDKRKIKFTDYGIEIFNSMANAQKDWESPDIIKISNLDRGQILIRAGETFIANRVFREIISKVRRELCIIDPYIGATLFDIIEDKAASISIKIITSKKAHKNVSITYKAYKNQYSNTEMRIMDSAKLHDRFILLDRTDGYHIGSSIKDLGRKDTQLNPLTNPIEQINLFEQRWKESAPI